MRISRLFLVLGATAILLLARPMSIAQSTSYRLTASLPAREVVRLEERSRKGNTGAALALYRHYGIGLGDVKRGLIFACRAGDLGSCDGAEIAADILIMPWFLDVRKAVHYRQLYERNCHLAKRTPTSTRMWIDATWEVLHEYDIKASTLEPLKNMSLKRN
jgi:hypothetical protein